MADVLVPHIDNNHDAVMNALIDQFGIDPLDARAAVDATIDWGKAVTDADLWQWIENAAYAIKSKTNAENQGSFLNPAPGAGASPASKPGSNDAIQNVLRLAKGMGLYDGDPDHFQWTDAERSAVRAYQQRRGLTVSGEVDAATVADAQQVGQFLGAPHRAAASNPAPTPSNGSPAPATSAAVGTTPQSGPPAANTGAHLTADDIAYYAQQAGFTGDGLRNIVAIALAESNGNGHAVGDSGQSHGLFQVYAPAHPQYDAQKLMDDPLYAAQAAYAISRNGTNFDAWTTWTHSTPSGAAHPAQQFLTVATAAVQNVEKGYKPTGSPGTPGDPSLDSKVPRDTPPDQVEAYIRQHYPDVAAFLTDPAMKMILFDAAYNGKPDDEIQAAVRQTAYWKTHGPSSRAFDVLLAEDPNAAAQVLKRAEATVTDLFGTNGVPLDPATLGQIAKDQIRNGAIGFNTNGETYIADQNALNTLVAGNVTTKTGPGAVTASRQQIKQWAQADYLIPITDDQATMYAAALLNGTMTETGVRDALRQQSQERYPWLKQSLDANPDSTPGSVTSGLRATIANTLEIDPATVDLTQAPYHGVLEFYDGNAKAYRSMTTPEAAQWSRSQPGFKGTKQYQQQDASFSRGLIDFTNGG